MERCDIAIIGAGPYGLAAAAHLRTVQGLDIRLFGEPMSFWERHMPEGMCLRSPWAASHIADPDDRLTLDVYRAINGNDHLAEPLRGTEFVKYGHWFHREVALPADPTKVTRIDRAGEGYRLVLENGNALYAWRIVVAAGIQPFAYRPKLFESLPTSLVTHTSEQRDFRNFLGRAVLVIGAGQSALEAAVFLHEAGANVEAVNRNPVLHWVGDEWLHSKAIGWMFYGKGDVGPAGLSRVVQHPTLFRQLPRWIQDWWGKRAVRPAVAHWLKPRASDLLIHTGRFPLQVHVQGERLRIRFNDGTERVVDHVVLGTGYRVNIGRYPFLSSEIVERLDLVNGYPRLNAGFETSLPGLHFLGAPAAWSFGPLMRFVAGTEFTARALRRQIIAVTKPRLVSVCSENSLERQSPRSEANSGEPSSPFTLAFPPDPPKPSDPL